MPKVRKVKRRKTYKVSINRKRLRNKLRKLPTITCPQVKDAWQSNKSIKTNLIQMGLSYDPNISSNNRKVRREIVENINQTVSDDIFDIKNNKNVELKQKRNKCNVAMELENDAKAPRQNTFKLPNGQVQFLTYLMDKYDDNYEAMARDKKNYYQLTWRQIRSRINTFKGIPEQYGEYLLKKGDIILDNPESLEETRKKLAEENVKKYCVAKKIKKQKTTLCQWIEESIENENIDDDFNTTVTLNDSDNNDEIQSLNKNEKLQLFSDDEDDNNEKTNKKNSKKYSKVMENQSMESDSDDDDGDTDLDDDDDDDALEFKDLNSMSDEDLSDDDMLDDNEFATDTD